MMRLAMWPSSKMWSSLEQHIRPFLSGTGTVPLDGRPINHNTRLLSMHFRCGDLNFKGKRDELKVTVLMFFLPMLTLT